MAETRTDEELMQLVKAGEIPVFEELVRRYRAALMRVAMSKLQDGPQAEDVVQEALLAAFAARATYNPQFAFRTWLWTITLRLCSLHYRRQSEKRTRQVICSSEYAEQAVSPAPTVLDGIVASERWDQLLQSLSELPEPQADAIRLRYFGGLSYDEIAAAMSSSVSGAKQRVRQGLERLSLRLREKSGVES